LRASAATPKTIICSDNDLNQALIRYARFPPPWSVEDNSASFVVRHPNGQQLAYVYFEDEPGRRSAAKLLEQD